jgi:hypothetical protein
LDGLMAAIGARNYERDRQMKREVFDVPKKDL